MKIKIRVIIAMAGALLVGAIVWVTQRNRSQNAWEQASAELAAKGLSTEWNDMIPPPVPDASNFFAHPAVQELIGIKGEPRPSETNSAIAPMRPPAWPERDLGQPFLMHLLKELPRTRGEEHGTNKLSIEDLEEWSRGGDIIVRSILEARERPTVRLPGEYSVPVAAPLPNFVATRNLAQFLGSRARVHLLTAKPGWALEDLDAVEAAQRVFRARPVTLVGAMMHVAMGGLYLEVVKDGLREGLWSEAELQGLAERLLRMNLIAPVQDALKQGELAGVNRFFEQLAGPRSSEERKIALQILGATQLTPNDIYVRAAPTSWIRKNQALHARLIIGFIESMDGEKKRYDAARNAEAIAKVNAAFSKWSPHSALAAMGTPNFQRAGTTMVKNQIGIDMAALVCALERHKMEAGRYPGELAELVPVRLSHLPHDPFTGGSYIYRREGDSFTLYSVGANGKDDGASHGESFSHEAAEDWVWGREKPFTGGR